MKNALLVFLTLSVLGLGYNQIRLFGFGTQVSKYIDYLKASAEHDRDGARFDSCQMVRFLNKKMAYKAWTNCWYPEFGKSIDDMEPSYEKKSSTSYDFELAKKNNIENGVRAMLRLKEKEYPIIPGVKGATYEKCTYKGQPLQIYYRFDHALWTDQEAIYVPEALEVTNCKKDY